MFELDENQVREALHRYSLILERVKEVVNEIGFLDNEYNALEIEKTRFSKNYVTVTAYDRNYDVYDSTSCSFPYSFLFEDRSKHKNWYRIKKSKEEKEHEEWLNSVTRKRELEELERLKAKYE